MCRMKTIIAVFLLCMMPFTMVHAQREAGSYTIGAIGGVGMVMSPEAFKDWTKMGKGFGGEFKFNMTEMTSLGISYTNFSFPINTDQMKNDMEPLFQQMVQGTTVEFDPFNIKASIISANLIQYFTSPEASSGFYGTIGAGYYMLKTEDGKMTISVPGQPVEEEIMEGGDTENKIGLNGGLGVEILIGETIGIFVEGKYHYILSDMEEDDDTQEMEEALGKSMSGKLSFIGILGGLIISL